MSSLPGDSDPVAAAGHGRVPVGAEGPADLLVSGAVGDRCVNCSAPLSSDQRYCVVCGERRGAPRFTLPVTPTAETADATPPPTRGPRGGRFSTGTTLIAGVATLLLALLVGVLIGHNPTPKTVAAAPVRIVTVGGGSAAAPSASTPASTSTGASSGGAKAKSKGPQQAPKPKKQTAAVKKQAAKKEASAASKVLGGKGTPPPTVTVGAKGSGKGYSKKTHKFTGSFFGQ